jgi:hypothetical protein
MITKSFRLSKLTPRGRTIALLATTVLMLVASAVSASALPLGETHDFGTPSGTIGLGGITVGPEGNLWFSEETASKIGEINPTTDATSDFATPTASALPEKITVGPEGNLWFTELGVSKIGEINPTTHATSDFATPTPSSTPIAIAVGPDGNLWFSEPEASKIGEIGAGAEAASLAAPVVAGSGQAGTQQVCDGELWSNFAGQQPSLEAFPFDGYQWLLDGSPLVGQTGQAYIPSAAEVGHALSCGVSATYPLTHTTAVATSAPVSVIAQSSGPTGTSGATGAAGASGAVGATGPSGSAGKVELVTCTTVAVGHKKRKQKRKQCTAKLVSGPVSFATSAAVQATLRHDGRVYASGTLRRSGAREQLILQGSRPLVRGRYTLILRRRLRGRWTTMRQQITLG